LFHLFEEWQDETVLGEHFTSSHMGEFVVALGTVLDGDMPTTKYQVSEHGPL
jgi:quinol monooxygenase YgiN